MACAVRRLTNTAQAFTQQGIDMTAAAPFEHTHLGCIEITHKLSLYCCHYSTLLHCGQHGTPAFLLLCPVTFFAAVRCV
jgi:hypothetical protein